MIESKCKICRRAGEKLFLKGVRCSTPKCAVIRKPYAPGVHGKSKKKGRVSEYGLQLRQKQKLRETYGMREKQFRNYVSKVIQKKIAGNKLLEFLELRLDNVIFRLGFADSRGTARQIVSHGHILVNNRRVTISSYSLKIGDIVKIRPISVTKGIFNNLDIILKKYNPSTWLSLDKIKKEGKILSNPLADEISSGINVNTIIEFYSR